MSEGELFLQAKNNRDRKVGYQATSYRIVEDKGSMELCMVYSILLKLL